MSGGRGLTIHTIGEQAKETEGRCDLVPGALSELEYIHRSLMASGGLAQATAEGIKCVPTCVNTSSLNFERLKVKLCLLCR